MGLVYMSILVLAFKAYLQLFFHLILIWTWNTPIMQSPREKLVQIFYVRNKGQTAKSETDWRKTHQLCALGLRVTGLIPIGAFWGALWNGHRTFLQTWKSEYIPLIPLPLGPELSHAVNSLVLPDVSKPQTGWLDSYRHLMEDEGRLGQKAGDMLCSWGEVTPAGSWELQQQLE